MKLLPTCLTLMLVLATEAPCGAGGGDTSPPPAPRSSPPAPNLVPLPPMGNVEGRVIARAGRGPVPYSKVVVLGLRLSFPTDSTGSYRIVGIPAGPQRLRAQAPEMDPVVHPIEVEEGKTARLDFEMDPYRPPPQGAITGRISRAGGLAPLAHAFVTVSGLLNAGATEDGGMRAGEDGVFRIRAVEPGWQEVRITAMGFEDARRKTYVEDGRTTLVFADLRPRSGQPGAGRAPAEKAIAEPPAKSPDAESPPPFEPVGTLDSVAGGDSASTPFSDSAFVHFDVPRNPTDSLGTRDAVVGIFDGKERPVRTLVSMSLLPGAYLVAWDGKDDAGWKVPPGLYLCRARAGGETIFEKRTRTPL